MVIPVSLASQANAGSNLCPSKQVCIYEDNNFVGLMGYRRAGLGIMNVSSKNSMGCVDRVTELLELHQTETGSTLAGEILAQGAGGIRESFMKVLPRDYATMMKAMVDAEEHGLDENETTFMEVSHG